MKRKPKLEVLLKRCWGGVYQHVILLTAHLERLTVLEFYLLSVLL